MNTRYQLTDGPNVVKTPDWIRVEPGTELWDEYQTWLDDGNAPDPSDPMTETAATPSIAVDAEFLRTIENAQTVTDVKMAILDAVKRQAQGG